jgi:hypothetical protein
MIRQKKRGKALKRGYKKNRWSFLGISFLFRAPINGASNMKKTRTKVC